MKKFTTKEQKNFSIVARAKSFAHAWRGIRIFLKTTHNAWIQIVLALGVIVAGILFSITLTEWALLVFSIGLVITTEAMNTAFEIDIDLTSPEYHPYARDTKDVAAAAVLIASLTAISIGLIVFVPYVVKLFS